VVNIQNSPEFSYPIPGSVKADLNILYPDVEMPLGIIGLLQQLAGTNEPSEVPLTQELLDRFNNREIVFVIYGKIEYEDIFNVRRWAINCGFTYHFTGGVTGKPPLAIQKCIEYTQTDDN